MTIAANISKVLMDITGEPSPELATQRRQKNFWR